jgi:hypothetical protein
MLDPKVSKTSKPDPLNESASPEEQIRERAYHLYESGGRQDGQADQHWLTAERQILEPQVLHTANRN